MTRIVWLLVGMAGCAPPSAARHPARLTQDAEGHCFYTRAYWCRPDERCERPEPARADCAPRVRSAQSPDADDWRPPTRRGWVRVRERLVVSPNACGYYADAYCPPPDHPTRSECDPPEFRQVACSRTTAGARVEPFVVRRLSSTCVAYPALECPLGECDLPQGQPTSCPRIGVR